MPKYRLVNKIREILFAGKAETVSHVKLFSLLSNFCFLHINYRFTCSLLLLLDIIS